MPAWIVRLVAGLLRAGSLRAGSSRARSGRRGDRAAARLGRRAERLAARRLAAAGYRILHRNCRIGRDEADLVTLAPDGTTLVIVEVKCRATHFAPPETAIDRRKRRNLIRFAERLRRRPAYADRPIRFDAVAITWPPGEAPRVTHYVDAFSPSSGR